MNRHLLVAALAAACALTACSGDPERVITIPDPTPNPVPFAYAMPADHFGDGEHKVIDDIPAGIYRTGGSTVADYPVCSWQLMAGDHLVASGSATGAVSIVIEPVYTSVRSDGCLEWVRTS